MSDRVAGWRSRQSTTIRNCGKETTVIIWQSQNSNGFNLIHQVKEVGQQKHVIMETIAQHDVALALYHDIAQQALVEVVNPPDPGKQIVGVIDGDDDEG